MIIRSGIQSLTTSVHFDFLIFFFNSSSCVLHLQNRDNLPQLRIPILDHSSGSRQTRAHSKSLAAMVGSHHHGYYASDPRRAYSRGPYALERSHSSYGPMAIEEALIHSNLAAAAAAAEPGWGDGTAHTAYGGRLGRSVSPFSCYDHSHRDSLMDVPGSQEYIDERVRK